MSFVYSQYFIIVLLASVLWIFYSYRQNKKFAKWVQDHWFYKLSFYSTLSIAMQVFGVILLMLAMLDLRGPEKLIQSQVSNQKTLILIDTSASMFVEDVRPNRFEKALLLVKHYVKKSIGQKISIAVFSDFQKTIVPFTDDIDLIEARIDSLKDLNLNRGGTSLSLAIQEGVQNFQVAEGGSTGNILVFTDAEETDGGIDLTIPETMSVGIVGIGTRKGGPVPMRNDRGEFIRNKTFQGELVVSKLDETFLKKFGEDIPYFKFWIATSYTLPTNDILNFFNRSHQLKLSKNNYRIRPVEAHKLLIPAMLLLSLGYLLKFFPTYLALCLLLGFNSQTFAQINSPLTGGVVPGMEDLAKKQGEKKGPVKSEETLDLEKRFANGELSDEGVNYLASKLLEDGFVEDSAALYKENLKEDIKDENIAHHFNHASAMLQNEKQKAKAIEKYKDLLDYIEKNPKEDYEKIEKTAKLNILKSFKQNQGGGGKGEDDKEKKDQKDKSSEQNKSDGKGDPKDKDEKGKDGKDEKKEQEKPKEDMRRKDEGDKKESEAEKNARKKKLPALLKQLMNDDNKLQKRMIDAKTTKRKTSEQKDW